MANLPNLSGMNRVWSRTCCHCSLYNAW